MKFKTIFFIFNAIIILSFLFFFTMPLFILGLEQFIQFLSKYWLTLTLFLITLIILNTYFIVNWKFFKYLENEDWYGLITYLETRIYKKNRLSRYTVKILLNSYLCTSNIEGIRRLEHYIKEKKPSLIGEYAVQFGIPYLMAADASESERFFEKLLKTKSIKGRSWIMWNYGITQLQLNKFNTARDAFSSLLYLDNDHIVFLLSLYMMRNMTGLDDVTKNKFETGKEEFCKAYTKDKWIKKLEKQRSHIQVISLLSIIQDATNWIFPEENEEKKEKENVEEQSGKKVKEKQQ